MTNSTDTPMGLLAWVYRSGSQDCTNGGVTSRVNKVIVTGPGIPRVFPVTADTPELKLVPWFDTGKLLPADLPKGAHSMFGGNYVGTSDSRFASVLKAMGASALGLVPVHDRVETSRQSRELSI